MKNQRAPARDARWAMPPNEFANWVAGPTGTASPDASQFLGDLRQAGESLTRWYRGAPWEKRAQYKMACARIMDCIKRQSPVLALGNLGLRDLPDDVWKMHWLRQLHVGGNALTKIPYQIAALRSLSHLTAGHNQIDFVDEWLGSLHHLQTLDLSHNQLSVLPSNWANLRALRNLYLQDNPLQRIPPDMGSLDRDCTIMLSPPTPTDLLLLRPTGWGNFTFRGRTDSPVVVINQGTHGLWVPYRAI